MKGTPRSLGRGSEEAVLWWGHSNQFILLSLLSFFLLSSFVWDWCVAPQPVTRFWISGILFLLIIIITMEFNNNGRMLIISLPSGTINNPSKSSKNVIVSFFLSFLFLLIFSSSFCFILLFIIFLFLFFAFLLL